ncbi:flagellar protein FliT [Aneurinibacillus danicus]|uniref:Flagellar protein FliT n=1 Tax=Aneurinibacillus danicus TaxID=267746 RepID=A0A511VB84_9BACL|nr:flagellar protein FliT [Aneurinibacillus danicus]GEN36190.1 hypothetical protein ADA01nite_36500 [Aneurinibacillus danicus]
MYSKERLYYLEQFLAYTEELVTALEEERYEELDALLEKRQQVIVAVDALDAAASPQVVQASKPLYLSLLTKIEQQDRQFRELAEKKKQETAYELQKIRASKRLNRSYRNSPYSNEGYYIDQTIGSTKV